MTKEFTGVENWYECHAKESLVLLRKFVEFSEEAAIEMKERYRNDSELVVVENPGYLKPVEQYRGLTDTNWNLEALFLNYFPNLQRRSALLTIVGLFETEFHMLCKLYEEEKDHSVSITNLNGKGVERSVVYLERVIGLDAHRVTSEWNEIKNIQKIRNISAHQDGSVLDASGNKVKAIIDYINSTATLDLGNSDTEVYIEEGYLLHVYDVFNRYFKLIADSIALKESA